MAFGFGPKHALGMFALSLAMPAGAQAIVNGKTVYEAAFFAPFSPATALQIVQQVPGFQLDRGDSDVRGFGQAAGNAVINGQRPSAKSDTLETILARIPASRVERIEIASGDLFGAEFSGRPQVVNLVLREGGGVAGTLDARLARSFDGKLYPQGSASVLLKRGKSTFNASAGVENEDTTERGTDTLLAVPGGKVIEFRRKLNELSNPEYFLTASWAHDDGANRLAHLNGRFERELFDFLQSNDVFPAAGPIRDDVLTERNREREIELGGDITRPLFGGGIKLIGLLIRNTGLESSEALQRIESTPVRGFAQRREDRSAESLARLVWTRSGWSGWSVETGGEVVLNRLESDVLLEEIAADGSRTRIDLPIDQAVVKEWRGELFVNAGRSLTPAVRMDIGLTWETSDLTVSGDVDAKRALQFWKPKASLEWQIPGSAGWRLQLSVERTVAQLRFEDFISVAELANERVNGGNADLVPQRAWEFRATAQRPILGDGLLKLELGYDQVSLVQDRVPTPEGFDAPGNLGNGRQLIARGTLEAPLARFGIKGGRLRAYVSYIGTSVQDPYTLQNRAFSGTNPIYAEASFRQDLGSFAWGVEASRGGRTTFFRRDELDSFQDSGPFVTGFAEFRPSSKTVIAIGVENATDSTSTRQRKFFVPNRTTRNPSVIENRERNIHVVPYISVKHSFG